MKQCSKCGQVKPNNMFYKISSNKNGKAAHCKSCESKRKRYSKYGHCKNYLIISSSYDTIHNCQCCGKPFGKEKHAMKCVDHSGDWIRGIICHSCNTGLGQFQDTLSGLLNAVSYLERSEEWEKTTQ